jgi:hypothetical protein
MLTCQNHDPGYKKNDSSQSWLNYQTRNSGHKITIIQ